MFLLVGLGNPGSGYAGHRHNIGFMAVDEIVRRHGFSAWRKRFHGLAADGTLAGEKVVALKPLTFMNDSGRSVGEAMRFFQLEPGNVIVIHDEIDLAPAKLRVKTGGGVAVHNGLRSIGAHIGPDFQRVRIGVGHPGVKDAVQYYVLHDFAKEERAWVDAMIDAIAANAPLLTGGKSPSFQNKVHLALNPAAERADEDGDEA